MPELSTLLVFVAASVALTISPGPAVLYITARSVEGGRGAGLVSAAGISAGGLVHVGFAAVGLSAVLASSAAAFSVVKWVGVAYLVYLGLSRILGRDEPMEEADEATEGEETRGNYPSIFRQAILVEIFNPKVALFFLAFLPQFVHSGLGPAWIQIAVLGLVYTAVALSTDSVYALIGGAAGEWARRRNASRGFRLGRRYVVGGIYIALGAVAAATGRGEN